MSSKTIWFSQNPDTDEFFLDIRDDSTNECIVSYVFSDSYAGLRTAQHPLARVWYKYPETPWMYDGEDPEALQRQLSLQWEAFWDDQHALLVFHDDNAQGALWEDAHGWSLDIFYRNTETHVQTVVLTARALRQLHPLIECAPNFWLQGEDQSRWLNLITKCPYFRN